MELYVKIKSSFLVIIVIMAGGAGVVLWNQNTLREAFHSMRNSYQLEEDFLECRRQEKNFVLRQDAESLRLHQTHYDSLHALTTRLTRETLHPGIREKFVALEQSERSYHSLFAGVVRTLQTGSVPQGSLESPAHPLVQEARRVHSLIYEIRDEATRQFTKTRASTHMVNLAALLLSVFLAVILAGYLSDRIRDHVDTKPETGS